MPKPLLTVEEVAQALNLCPATIRRAGNSRDPRHALPDHFDFGPRIRRYLPAHIEARVNCRAPDAWLMRRYGPVLGDGPLGLSMRVTCHQEMGAVSI